MTFVFPITAQLLALAQHAIAHHQHQRLAYTGPGWDTPEEKPAKPALLLVKDSGVYLMSPFTLAGAPPEARLRECFAPGESKLVVIYADGHRPEDGHLGGDDFGEDLEEVPDMIVRAGSGTLVISLTSHSISSQVLPKLTNSHAHFAHGRN
jgi:hypothetical protein